MTPGQLARLVDLLTKFRRMKENRDISGSVDAILLRALRLEDEARKLTEEEPK